MNVIAKPAQSFNFFVNLYVNNPNTEESIVVIIISHTCLAVTSQMIFLDDFSSYLDNGSVAQSVSNYPLGKHVLEVDKSNFWPGKYLLRISSPESIKTIKFIKR